MRPLVGEGDVGVRFVVVRYIGCIVGCKGVQGVSGGGGQSGCIVTLVFLLQIDGRRLMRFDMAMRETRIRKMVRDITRMYACFVLSPVHVRVCERRNELRQRKQQERDYMERAFHGWVILTWTDWYAVCDTGYSEW